MFQIKLPQRKRCYPLLYPINMGVFSTWSMPTVAQHANIIMVPKVYYLQISLRRPQGKGLLIRHSKSRLKSKMRFFIIIMESLCFLEISFYSQLSD